MTTTHRQRIPEDIVYGRRLGRHIAHDPQSRDYAVDTASVTLRSANHNCKGLPLDQGDIGSCTANALCAALNSDPNQTKQKHGPYTENGAVRIYKLETRNEGEPYPPNDPGGSGLEVCKAGKELGYVSSYRHAFSVQTALLALVDRPVITGVNWYSSFDDPDKNGLVKITGSAYVRGGHEICPDELIVPDGATIDDLDDIKVGVWNSWGASYGLGGKFYWTAATWKQLLDEQGDVTVPYATS